MRMEAKFERFKEWLSSEEIVASRENSFHIFGREIKEKKDNGEEQEVRVRIFAKKWKTSWLKSGKEDYLEKNEEEWT